MKSTGQDDLVVKILAPYWTPVNDVFYVQILVPYLLDTC
jgi:hypothetical protein